jgi:hypothetical protein
MQLPPGQPCGLVCRGFEPNLATLAAFFGNTNLKVAAPCETIEPISLGCSCPLLVPGRLSDQSYQTGRSKHWIKVKNRKRLAMERVMMDARLRSLTT